MADADTLPSWRNSSTRDAITGFVAAVTDPASPDFVSEADRIAVFDNDGTLSTEMPLYTQLAFALDRSVQLGRPTTLADLQAGGLGAVFELLPLTHANITTDAFEAAARQWSATARDTRWGRAYPTLVYQPMLELLSLLADRGFECWIFSGGGTDFMRSWAPEVFGLPTHRFIGSSGSLTFQIGDAGPELLKGTDLAVLDDGPQKAISIHQAIGKRPLLAAGNTNGDLPMLQWTASNPHRTLQLVVSHTDADREFAYDHDALLGAGTDQLAAAAADNGWTVIDMAADWATVHPS
jgi:hypothetical protein